MFCKKGFFRNFAKFTGKHLATASALTLLWNQCRNIIRRRNGKVFFPLPYPTSLYHFSKVKQWRDFKILRNHLLYVRIQEVKGLKHPLENIKEPLHKESFRNFCSKSLKSYGGKEGKNYYIIIFQKTPSRHLLAQC